MPYFAMIHWSDTNISPVTKEDDTETMIWDTLEEAKSATKEMAIYPSREITIHDTSGEA